MSVPPRRLAWFTALVLASCAPSSQFSFAELTRLRGLAGEVDTDRLMATVHDLTQAHLTDTPFDCSRWHQHLEETGQLRFCQQTSTKAGALMEARLRELGLDVWRQTTSGEVIQTSNVVAEVRGLTHPDEVVLVGAHFDVFYGAADDNSTGVAGVLEIARILSQQRHARTLLFVGFDLEELGEVGSMRFVDQLPEEQRVVAALVLDSVGYYDTRSGSQASMPGLPSPDRGDFLAIVTNDPSLEQAAQLFALSDELQLSKIITLGTPGPGYFPMVEAMLRSDHPSFWSRGYPALLATDTARFRNPHYHRETDTPETLHPELFRRAVQSSLVALSHWAGGAP